MTCEHALYGAYLLDWYRTHNEGEPVSYDEFYDNELDDDEYMDLLVANAPELKRYLRIHRSEREDSE